LTFLSTLALTFGTLQALANLPQAYRIYRRKSAKDVSFWTYAIFLVGSIIWVLYGLEIENPAVIIANGVGILTLLAVLAGWLKYR
jgi:MtN3 and saliva related transmembrane protein